MPFPVYFTAGVFRLVSSWNILVPFSSGRIDVEAHAQQILIRYRLRTTGMLVITTLMIAPAFFMSRNSPSAPPYGVFLLGWLWLFGMNYVIGSLRIPGWLRSGVQAALDATGYPEAGSD